jgi:hypothetical protein
MAEVVGAAAAAHAGSLPGNAGTPCSATLSTGLGVKEGVIEAMRAMTFQKLHTLPWP